MDTLIACYEWNIAMSLRAPQARDRRRHVNNAFTLSLQLFRSHRFITDLLAAEG